MCSIDFEQRLVFKALRYCQRYFAFHLKSDSEGRQCLALEAGSQLQNLLNHRQLTSWEGGHFEPDAWNDLRALLLSAFHEPCSSISETLEPQRVYPFRHLHSEDELEHNFDCKMVQKMDKMSTRSQCRLSA